MNMQKAIVLDRLARIMKYAVLTIGAFMVFFPFLWIPENRRRIHCHSADSLPRRAPVEQL